MPIEGAKRIFTVLIAAKQASNRRMLNRLITVVRYQVLLANIGDIATLAVFGEQMIEWLVLRRAHRFGNRFVPLVAVCKYRIDIEHHTAKAHQLMLHHITYAEARVSD